MSKRYPARLYAILAREAPIGVIFRRGPTRWVQCIRWNTETDEFEPGQWFRGRIYERRGDLSPDGRLMVYFASKQGVKDVRKQSWTALSRPPYLTALNIWFYTGNYSGGGLFASNDRLMINEVIALNPASWLRNVRLKVGQLHASGGEEPVEGQRLERDGWVTHQAMIATYGQIKLPPLGALFGRLNMEKMTRWVVDSAPFMKGYTTQAAGVISKRQGSAVLRRTERIDGWDHKRVYDLEIDGNSLREEQLSHATWADFDQRGRLVVAIGGRILAADEGDRKFRELADFNDCVPAPFESPAWAREWPS